MHIKEIEIDGFKSYAQKQVIGQFDDQFNAITGLNGSGKSNILDSICFVLGITNLTCIRAQSNNDLIFKQGNAGITKAFVKITFDNTGARRFANYGDTVTITRTISISSGSARGSNNYTICGSNASCSAVADMFRSVGLNVNNPHFLIMQGRITKVLNMKPLEILGMIEEAAGTKMYDAKRNQAVANMEKKDTKIEEIRQLMENEIMPTVQRMKDDREEYLKYQKYERDIQLLKRKHAAFVFNQAITSAKACEAEMEVKEKEKEEAKTSISDIEKNIETILSKQKELEKEKGDVFKKEQAILDEEVKKHREIVGDLERKKDDFESVLNDGKTKMARLIKTFDSDKKSLEKVKEELKSKEGELGGEEERGNEMEAELKAVKAKLLALEQGMTTNDAGEMVTLESQITESRTRLTEISTEVKQLDVRKKELEKKKKEKEGELSRYDKEDKEFTQFRGKTEAEMNKLKTELSKMTFDGDEYGKKRAELEVLEAEIRTVTKEVNEIDNLMKTREAPFRDVPGIDRARDVGGMIPRYFKMKNLDDRHAIEHLLGAHNQTTVVRSGDVASKLMEKKAFIKRTTCLPLDGRDDEESREAKERAARKLHAARSLAGNEQVDYAVDLIDFKPEHAFICKYKLSGVLVCSTKDTANNICFNKDIGLKVITRDGEFDFNPSGIVGGGARVQVHGGIDLRETNRWHEGRERLEEMIPMKARLEKEVAAAERDAARWRGMKERLAELEEKMEEQREKFKFSAAATIRADLDSILGELPQLDGKLKESTAEIKELKEKITKFEERKKNEKAFAEKEKSDVKKKLKELTENQKKAKGGFEKAKATLEAMRSEISSLTQSVGDGEAMIGRAEEERMATEKECEEARAVMARASVDLDAAIAKRSKFVEKLKEHDDKTNQLKKMVEQNRKQIQQLENQMEEIERERSKLGEEAEAWKKEAKSERKANPWIEDEKEHFGQKGTDYDFTGYSAGAGKKRMEEMENEMKKMNSHINMNTMSMLAPSEERVLALKMKQAQIEKDKHKLLETIAKLDEKKKIELLAAYKSVNKDFNGIFSTLLPGTSAKLEPADGVDPLKGIEIKVAFNNKWKDSLGELSGGQRSLVALSLVLAMLKFRPAPLYILDEVDAALDLSHTQNIGAMIKTHFKESQFIIVSLKEGMFNNANIIFRTRFVDGTSHVSRIDNSANK